MVKNNFIDIVNISLESKKVHNKRKQKLCQVAIKNSLYDVYEYDLRDLMTLEGLAIGQKEHLGASDIITMLVLAIPDCPEEHLKDLTQTETTELLAMINGAIKATDLVGPSAVFH